MTERHATFFVCDDLLVALNGKYTIAGLYTGDLLIAGEQSQLGQLVVFVQVETPLSKPFRSLSIHVQFPGDPEPKILDASAMIPKVTPMPGRSTMRLRIPFLIAQPMLRPGPIEVKIFHEEGEMSAGKQWILNVAQFQEIQAQAAKS